jgi:hypothetical protein
VCTRRHGDGLNDALDEVYNESEVMQLPLWTPQCLLNTLKLITALSPVKELANVSSRV